MTRSSCCPICYKIEHLSQGNCEALKSRELVQQRFFKFFQRYLNEGNGELSADIKVDKKVRQLRQYEYFHQPEKLSEFGMLACGDCHSQMEAFCDLYGKLKATELLLNWKVWTMKNIMTGAQRVTSRVKCFRAFIQQMEVIESEVEEIMNPIVKSRKSLIVKCSRKIENATPKLSIVRWEPYEQKASNGEVPCNEIRLGHSGHTITNRSVEDEVEPVNTSSKSGIPGLEHADTTNNGNNAEESQNSICISQPSSSCAYKGDRNGDERLESETASASSKPATDKIVEANKKASYLNNFDDTMKMEADQEYADEITPTSSTSEVQLYHVQSSNTGSQEGICPLEDSLEHTSTGNANSANPNKPSRSHPVVEPGTSKLETAIEANPTTTCDESRSSETRSRLRSTHKCHKCWRTFSTGNRLQSHEQEEHGEDNDMYNDMDSILSEDEQGHTDNDMEEVSPQLSSSSSSSSQEEFDDDFDIPPDTEDDISESKTDIKLPSRNATGPSSSQTILAAEDATQNSNIKLKRLIHKDLVKHHTFRLRCPDCQSLFKDVQGILTHRKFSSACSALYDPQLSIAVDVLVPPSNSESSNIPQDDDVNGSKFSVVFAKISIPQEIFICEKCNLAVYSSEDMEVHNKLHGSFPCHFCGAKEDYAPNLSHHELEHAVTEGKEVKRYKSNPIFYCARCDFGTGSRERYILHHMKTHLGLVVSKPKCAICKTNGYFATNGILATHFKTHHDLSRISSPEDSHTCPEDNCGAYFLLKQQLTNHIDLRHNESKNILRHRAKNPGRRRTRGESSLSMIKSRSNELSQTTEYSSQQAKINRDLGLQFRLKCPDCSILFKNMNTLLFHRRDSTSCSGSYDANVSMKVEVRVPPKNKSGRTGISFGFGDKHFSNTFAIIELPQRILQCGDCGIVLYSSEKLEAHKLLHGKFTCNFCQMEISYAKSLALHELQHASSSSKASSHVNCPRCEVSCSNGKRDYQYIRHYLESHMSLKWVDEPSVHICIICKTTRESLRKGELGGHLKKSHDLTGISDPREIVRCQMNECDAYFLTRGQLCGHLKYHHNIGKDQRRTDGAIRVNCKDCDKTYAEPNALHMHRLKYHVPLEKVIHCPFKKCNKVYETKQQLEFHLASYKERHKALDKPKAKEFVNCPVCNKGISSSKSIFLKLHMKTHETSHVCEQCGKQFQRRDRLEIHKLTHTGPESWKYSCTVCGKKCLNGGKLNEHMRTHTKETPYVCEICGQKYAHRHNLRIHVNNKHGDEVQDNPKKYNTKNLTSKKGIKRKKMECKNPGDDGSNTDQ